MSYWRLCSSVLISLLVIGCSIPADEQEEYPEAARLYSLPREEQLERFQILPREEQYAVAVYAETHCEPPDTRFSSEMAKQGGLIVPFLLSRLRSETDQSKRFVVVRMLHTIGLFYCDLSKREDVRQAIQNEITSISDSESREWSGRMLREIETHEVEPYDKDGVSIPGWKADPPTCDVAE